MSHVRLLLMLASALGAVSLGAQPTVNQVEPPSWWAQTKISPLRVLLRGHGLTGARVSAPVGMATVSRVQVSSSGTSVLFDLKLAAEASGRVPLRVATAAGATTVDFEILPAPARATPTRGFTSNDVIYLILPDRFANGDPKNDDPAVAAGLWDRSKPRSYHGGDLAGIQARLPYLKSLGVTAIWLTPIYDNANRLNPREVYDGQALTGYHGYGAVDFYAVDEHLGTMAALRELTSQAHALGLRVIQDQVANHTGAFHPWVEDPPTKSWLNGTAGKHLDNNWQTWTIMDPHADAETRRGTLEGWFGNVLPDLNQNDAEARRYLIQNAIWWVGAAGFDGIRQDTWPYVPRSFWRDWSAAIHREFPGIHMVGEVLDPDPAFVAYGQGGRKGHDGIDTGVDSVFDFPLFYAIRSAFAEGKTVRSIPRALAHDHLYADPARLVTFLGLHDVKRFLSEPGATMAGLKLAHTFLLTARGIPLLYYGDEIGMAGGEDPDNRKDFPGGWAEDARNAFTKEGRSAEEKDLWEHVARLNRLRAELRALRQGETRQLVVEEQVYAFARQAGKEEVLVVINNGGDAVEVDVPVLGVWQERLEGNGKLEAGGAGLKVTVGRRSARVFVSR